MLSKEKCIQAIHNWNSTKFDFSKVKRLINPTSVFCFSKEDRDWLSKHNKCTRFYSYIGVYNEKLSLIVVPLNELGKRVELDAYLALPLTSLKSDVVLSETDEITVINKTVLSKNLEITSHHKETILPVYNEPTITERASVEDIEKWKNDCMDWFYCECKDFKGERIFGAFSVPFADLNDDDKYDEVYAMFGFKYSFIYNRQIPVLIFVANDSKLSDARIIRQIPEDNSSATNTTDWSRPCPPMCKDIEDVDLLDR